MTESEYETVVKLMIEKLERYKDEIAEKDAEIECLKNKIRELKKGGQRCEQDLSRLP